MAIERVNPTIVKIRGLKLDIMKEGMDSDRNVYLKYSKTYRQVSNYWKFFIGQTKNLKRMNIVEQKEQEEKKFKEWSKGNPDREKEYGTIIADLESDFSEIADHNVQRYHISEAIIRGPAVFNLSYFHLRQLNAVLADPESSKDDISKQTEKAREGIRCQVPTPPFP